MDVDKLIYNLGGVSAVRSELNKAIGIQARNLERFCQDISSYKTGLDISDDAQLFTLARMVKQRRELQNAVDAMQDAFAFPDYHLEWHIKSHAYTKNQCWNITMEFEPETILMEMNFSQAVPNTPIAKGVKGLTFEKCNLHNCKIPEDALVKNCLEQQTSFCSHLVPELVKYGLPECTSQCWHHAKKKRTLMDFVLLREPEYEYKNRLLYSKAKR